MSRLYPLIKMTKGAAIAAVRPWSYLNGPSWAFFVIPFLVWMIAITTMGPFIQDHTAPLLSSSAPTIYDAVYPSGMARFPSLAGWIGQVFRIEVLFIALITTLGSFAFRSVRGMAIGGGLSFGISYLLFDIFILLTNEGVKFGPGTVVIANITGAVALGLVISISLSVLKFVTSNSGSTPARYAFCTAIFFTFSMLTVTGVDLAIRIFFRPLDVRVNVLSGRNSEGTYGQTKEWEQHKDRKDLSAMRLNQFSLIPPEASGSIVTLRSIERAGEIKWDKAGGSARYNLEVFAFSGCMRGRGMELLSGRPAMSFNDVENVLIADGADELQVETEEPSTIDERANSIAAFWLKASEESEQFQAQMFVSEGSGVVMRGRSSVVIEVTHMLYQSSDDLSTVRPADRTILFQVDGVKRQIKAVSAAPRPGDERLRCAPMKVESDYRGTFQTAMPRQPVMSLVFRLRRVPNTDGVLTVVEHHTNLSDGNGWLTIKDVKRQESGLGDLGFLMISRDLTYLEVENEKIEIQPSDSIQMLGQFSAAYTKDGDLRVTGRANAFWRNRTRLNLTLWERLAEGWQLAFWGAVGAALLALGQFVRTTLRGQWVDEPSGWLR